MVVTLALMVPAASVGASGSNQTSQEVADEIVRLQGKADKTANAWAQAQIRQEELAGQIAQAQSQVDSSAAQFNQLQDQLAKLAVDRFMSGSSGSTGLLFASPIDQLQTEALSAAAYDAGAATLDEVETARTDLEVAQARLDALQADNDTVLATMADKQAQITAQLSQLEALRATLVDAEAKQAYADAVAKQKAKDEKARLDAQQAAVAQAASQAAAVAATSTSGPPTTTTFIVGGATVITPATSDTKPADSPLLPSAPDPAVGASDGGDESVAIALQVPQPDPVVSVSSFVCPVAGPVAFGDTWGDARSGGRHHEGVDIMSPFGTPEVAVVSGFATFKTNKLGGNVISLVGDDGNRYYYAHLSSREGGSRAVKQGEVMGYVGHTGDTSANHLHFEIHPGGGAAVNPYPTVRKYC
jgi:murein DD-endopeptidase MepM/ murein hydrolase activator NlpD